MKEKQGIDFSDFYKRADAMLKELAKTGEPIHLTSLKKIKATLVNTADLERTVDEREVYRQLLLAMAEAHQKGDRRALDYLFEFVESLNP